MAKMYPPHLPEQVLQNPKCRGEVDVFDALSKLPDEYEIFYNRNVRHGEAVSINERPIDFIVLHEQKGLLGIEVKGGQVRIGDDGGIEHYYEGVWNSIDPYNQVLNALHELWQTAKADGANYYIPINRAVIFPHVSRDALTQNYKHRLQDGTLCADELPMLALYIPKLFKPPLYKRVWKKGAFVDIRRRLQNMPQAERNYQSSTKIQKTINSQKPSFWTKNKFQKIRYAPSYATTRLTVEAGVAVEEKKIEIKDVFRGAPYISPKPDAYAHLTITSSKQTKSTRPKPTWRTLVIAAIVFFVAFAAFLYLFTYIRNHL